MACEDVVSPRGTKVLLLVPCDMSEEIEINASPRVVSRAWRKLDDSDRLNVLVPARTCIWCKSKLLPHVHLAAIPSQGFAVNARARKLFDQDLFGDVLVWARKRQLTPAYIPRINALLEETSNWVTTEDGHTSEELTQEGEKLELDSY